MKICRCYHDLFSFNHISNEQINLWWHCIRHRQAFVSTWLLHIQSCLHQNMFLARVCMSSCSSVVTITSSPHPIRLDIILDKQERIHILNILERTTDWGDWYWADILIQCGMDCWTSVETAHLCRCAVYMPLSCVNLPLLLPELMDM